MFVRRAGLWQSIPFFWMSLNVFSVLKKTIIQTKGTIDMNARGQHNGNGEIIAVGIPERSETLGIGIISLIITKFKTLETIVKKTPSTTSRAIQIVTFSSGPEPKRVMCLP
jgi:hypothetical protein